MEVYTDFQPICDSGVRRHRGGGRGKGSSRTEGCLTSKTVESAALSLQRMYDVKSSDCLTTGMLSVCDGVANDVLKKNFQDTSGFLVDEA